MAEVTSERASKKKIQALGSLARKKERRKYNMKHESLRASTTEITEKKQKNNKEAWASQQKAPAMQTSRVKRSVAEVSCALVQIEQCTLSVANTFSLHAQFSLRVNEHVFVKPQNPRERRR